MSTIPTPGSTIVARKGAGADQGPQPRISFNDGGTTTVTVTDDPAQNEIDITITSAGGGGTDWLDQFFPASDSDDYKGTYATMGMPDGIDTTIRQTILIPDDIGTIVRADIIVIPNAAGVLRWQASTNFGQICANEGYQTHTDATGILTPTLTQNEIECLDFSTALTGATGGDLVGVEFLRTASNAADTINEKVHFIGIIIQGTV